jgi:predicted alpha/beta-fold hydrolase
MVSCGVDVTDVYTAVDFVSKRFNQASIYAVGFSAGANMLVKMMGEVLYTLQV